jgi:hypothetical protein
MPEGESAYGSTIEVGVAASISEEMAETATCKTTNATLNSNILAGKLG